TMGEAGYFGTLIDEADGGTGAGPLVASVVIEEVNRAGGDAATLNAQMARCGVLMRHGTPEPKTMLRRIANGQVRCSSVAATARFGVWASQPRRATAGLT